MSAGLSSSALRHTTHSKMAQEGAGPARNAFHCAACCTRRKTASWFTNSPGGSCAHARAKSFGRLALYRSLREMGLVCRN